MRSQCHIFDRLCLHYLTYSVTAHNYRALFNCIITTLDRSEMKRVSAQHKADGPLFFFVFLAQEPWYGAAYVFYAAAEQVW